MTNPSENPSPSTPEPRRFELSKTQIVETPHERINRVVGEAVGAASMAWHQTPTGIFDDVFARDIVDAVLAYIDDYADKISKDRVTMAREKDAYIDREARGRYVPPALESQARLLLYAALETGRITPESRIEVIAYQPRDEHGHRIPTPDTVARIRAEAYDDAADYLGDLDMRIYDSVTSVFSSRLITRARQEAEYQRNLYRDRRPDEDQNDPTPSIDTSPVPVVPEVVARIKADTFEGLHAYFAQSDGQVKWQDADLAQMMGEEAIKQRRIADGYDGGTQAGHPEPYATPNLDRIIRDQKPQTEDVTHFAPYGAQMTPCGQSVPSSLRDMTGHRDLTTCPDCRARFTNPTDEENTMAEDPNPLPDEADVDGLVEQTRALFGGIVLTETQARTLIESFTVRKDYHAPDWGQDSPEEIMAKLQAKQTAHQTGIDENPALDVEEYADGKSRRPFATGGRVSKVGVVEYADGSPVRTGPDGIPILEDRGLSASEVLIDARLRELGLLPMPGQKKSAGPDTEHLLSNNPND